MPGQVWRSCIRANTLAMLGGPLHREHVTKSHAGTVAALDLCTDARAKDVAGGILHTKDPIFVNEQEIFFSACDSYVRTRVRLRGKHHDQ